MIRVETNTAGLILPVRVQPGARRSGITGEHDGSLKLAVTEAAEKGKANAAAIETLCESLSLRPRQLEIVSGATARQKKFLVRGLNLEELNDRLIQAISASKSK
jgi:uncharacterized protein (TIGR00251 family)